MTRAKQEKTIIASDINWLYANYNRIDMIMDVKPPLGNGGTLGYKVPHVKKNNYNSVYNNLIEEEKYTVCFIDMSIACMYYIFDNAGKIVGHNLMYMPAPNDENCGDDFDTICAKYIRIDYEQEGYHEIYHTQVHLHSGLYKTNFRIPLAHYCTPKEFIYFIIKYIYHSDCAFVDQLITSRNKTMLLTENEQKAMKIIFGQLEEIK